MPNRSEILARCPLFSLLPPADLEQVARAASERAVRRGALIFREGDACEGFFVVAQGSVRIYKVSADGRERTLHVIRPPHSFAEAAIFSDDGYPAFAEATSDTRVVLVAREPFLRLLEARPSLSGGLFRSLSQWLHVLLDQLEVETFFNARARLATWLLREVEAQGEGRGDGARVKLQQSRKAIAQQLGMAPETLSRIQSEFEDARLIRAFPRQIAVIDRRGLRDVVLGDARSPRS